MVIYWTFIMFQTVPDVLHTVSFMQSSQWARMVSNILPTARRWEPKLEKVKQFV